MDTIPVISKTPSSLKIVTACGHTFYAHNVKAEYRYDERIKVISNLQKYFTSINNPTPEQDAYVILLWHLFKDFLDAYNFSWLKNWSSKPSNRSLYILRNSQGFIKVGIAANVSARIVDLKYEFGGEWEVIKVYKGMANHEKSLHQKLLDYTYPIKNRHTGKYSQECFVDCNEVLAACLNLSNE